MRFIYLLTVALLSGNALSQSPVYQPAGAPADPRVEARWNFYRDYDQATGLMKQIAAAHPKWCRMESIGKSHGGRELWVLTIADQSLTAEKEAERPAFWIDGGIHANELQAVDVVLYTAWYLTETAERNEFTKRLLKERVFYLMPMMSPDSRDAHMREPNTTHSPRTGQLPIDDDRDGLFDEDPPEDIDGDGSLTFMYVKDSNGRLKRHPDYPDQLVDAKPDEAGEYTFLGFEGYDNDGDGRVNEDGDGRYDPNRDWAWQWQPSYIQRGSYRYPFSIPSNRQVAQFVMAHPNIAGAQSYHNTGGMILRGPGSKTEKWPREDIAIYDRVAKRGQEMLPGYKYMNIAEELYEVWGGETDWLFAMRGIFSFTNELNTTYNLFHNKRKEGDWFGPAEEQMKFDKLLLLGDGYSPLKEVKHPQYGKVLVGGKKKNWGRQPPSFMLEEECHRNMAFTLYHADQMPLVEIDDVEIKPLPGELRQITATVINRRIIPTRAAHDVKNGITPSDRIELAGPKVLAALVSDSVVFKEPRDVVRDPAFVRIDRLKNRSPKYIRWIVTGEQEPTLTVRSVKGGTTVWASE